MADKEYENFKNLSIEDLTFHAAGSGTGSLIEKAKLVLAQRMIEQQHEYAKQQIELQHTKNMELLKKQLRWIKFSIFVNAIAILGAVLLGWYLKEWKVQPTQETSIQQSIQARQESSGVKIQDIRHERKNDKVTSQPPLKGEKQKNR